MNLLGLYPSLETGRGLAASFASRKPYPLVRGGAALGPWPDSGHALSGTP